MKNSINAINHDLENGNQYKPIITISIIQSAQEITIKITDNGPGFPEQYKDKLLTPYFSLMPKGTGLGLAIVDKIIKDHNGKISFSNNLETKGATVMLNLPHKK